MCKKSTSQSVKERIAYLENLAQLIELAEERRDYRMGDIINEETGELIEPHVLPPKEDEWGYTEWVALNEIIKDLSTLVNKK